MAIRAFLCWVLAGSVAERVAVAVRRRRSASWSRPRRTASPGPPPYPGCSRATSPWSRPTAGSRVRHRRRHAIRADRRARVAGRVGLGRCATRSCCSSIATICAIRLPDQIDATEGEGDLVLRGPLGETVRRGRHPHPDPRPGRLRAARQLRAPLVLSGFLLMFVAFLLRDPDVRPDSDCRPELMVAIVIGAAGLGNAIGHRGGRAPAEDHAVGDRGGRAARRRRRRPARGALLRGLLARAARPDRRPGAGTGQGVPGRDDPARRPDPGPGQRVRPQRHHAASWRG